MLKRIFALIMSLLLSVSLLQQFVFANEFISVEFYDATTNKKIDKIDGQQNIYAKVKFTAPDDGDAAIVVGKYNADGTLESAVPQTAQSLTPGEMSVFTTGDVNVSKTDNIKVFAWDGIDNLVPVSTNYGEIKRQIPLNASITKKVKAANGAVNDSVLLDTGRVCAVVSEGTSLSDGIDTLTLTVKKLEQTSSGIQPNENEILLPIDVHIDGISKNNKTPVIVTVKEILAPGLNKGNLQLYHVENKETVKMQEVEAVSDLTNHNQFHYDALTGSITLAMATFSEIAVVSNTENAWNGTFATAFAGGSGTEKEPYLIANADQLAYLGDRVSNDNENYGGACYKLTSDINMGGEVVDNNGKLKFYPIGYGEEGWKGTFSGTFDGAGHTISNIYQNTWMLKGTYDGTYYNAAMGLFGYINGGTIKNLTVDNFSSDGEFTPTGVVAAYAVNSTFENIAITNCNPRVYNTGNGGIVGIGGNSDDTDTKKLTFTNITIDNTNKITALWGSWDVACGGLVGMFRGKGHVYMTNCHVAAQMDVYNDVCGNYQYYWYRYAGMLIGTNKNMVEKDGYTVPETTKFHAENCTVHFGEWNDYYYCELVANSLASYTHDHQFSRLEQITSLDEIKSGDTWTKTGNFLLISGDTKTCYHIVKNTAGNLVQHNHADAGEETVDGETVLKEDKQIIYLPFNQLFTGYGWGVKHIPVGEFEGVTILKRDVADSIKKFETKFTGDFLYRVGNQNTVSLGSLFEAIDTDNINNAGVYVTVDKVDENTNVSGTFKASTTENWEDGTIQFTGTGPVKVTIQDYDYCTPTVLYLEVVDAKNIITATSATANNVVLLNDCGFSSLEVSGGYTLYGNGFTMTCGSDSAASDMGYSFVTLNNGTLDNVQVVCPNFDYAALYKSNLTSSDNRSETDSTGKTRYYNAKSGVMASGNSQILNSRISGGRAALNVSGGNVVVDNSRIELGAVASILVGSANSLTLRDVTLVQKPTASTFDSTKTLMGFSVLMICNSEGNAAPVTIEGNLIQNAWVDENDSQYVPNAGKNIITTVLSNEEYTHDLDGDGTKESLNLGFAYMPESTGGEVNTTTIEDNRTNKESIPYDYAGVSIGTGKTYVYSYKYADGESIPKEFTETAPFVPNKYNDIITVSYSDTADGLTTGKSYGTNGWVYELNVDLDKLSGYALDFSKLSMSVNGVMVTDYKVNGSAKPASPVAVTAGGTTYKLTATVEGKEYTATYKVTGTETSKESPSLVASNYEAALLVGEAGNTLSKDTWHGATPVLNGIQIKYWSVAEKKYKTITLSDYTPTTAGKQNGTNAEWTYSPTNGDFTLTVKNETAVHSSNSVYAMPVVVNSKLYFVASGSNGLVNYGNSARTIKINYYFKDNNGGEELKFDHTWSIECANGNTCYDYSDFCNGTSKTFTIKSSNGNVCVTGDTLVTLANGSQKRIDKVTYEDKLLVWDFFNGRYAEVPSSIIFYHGDKVCSVLSLKFEGGTKVKVINNHGFFDVEENKFVFITEENVKEYLGHKFVKQNGDSYTSVKLIEYSITDDYVGSYSIQSAQHNNFITEGMFSITMPEFEGWFDYFEIGNNMKYDENKMKADIAKYGLYTYEDFADYVTYEQFIAFSGPYLKVLVGKGIVTYEQIIDLINMYVKN